MCTVRQEADAVKALVGYSLCMCRRTLEMPTSHLKKAFLWHIPEQSRCAHLAHRQVWIQFQSVLQSLMQKYKQSLSTIRNTQNIINIWSSFHQSMTCALQFNSKQKFSGAYRWPGVGSCKTMLVWELQYLRTWLLRVVCSWRGNATQLHEQQF